MHDDSRGIENTPELRAAGRAELGRQSGGQVARIACCLDLRARMLEHDPRRLDGERVIDAARELVHRWQVTQLHGEKCTKLDCSTVRSSQLKLAALVIAVTVVAGGLDASAARDASVGRLVFVRPSAKIAHSTELWLSRSDGRGQTRLVAAQKGWGVLEPTWSPNGRRIAYVRQHAKSARALPDDGELRVRTIATPSSRRLDLAPKRYVDFFPSWSPDGRRLAFIRFNMDCRKPPTPLGGCAYTETWLVGVDGKGKRRLVTRTFGRAAWSPDSSRMAVMTEPEPGGARGLQVISVAGARPAQRLPVAAGGYEPDWSPDGAAIAYEGIDRGIYAVSPTEAAQPRALTSPPESHRDSFPRWSPDGRRLAFVRAARNEVALHVISSDGADSRRLLTKPSEGGSISPPAWSRDGTMLAVDVVERSVPSVYLIRADGSGQRKISRAFDPDW